MLQRVKQVWRDPMFYSGNPDRLFICLVSSNVIQRLVLFSAIQADDSNLEFNAVVADGGGKVEKSNFLLCGKRLGC